MSSKNKNQKALTTEIIELYRKSVKSNDYESVVKLIIMYPKLLELEADANTSILLQNATQTGQTRTVEDILLALVDEIFQNVANSQETKNLEEIQETLNLFVQALLQLWASIGNNMSLKDFIAYIKQQKTKLKGKGLGSFLDEMLINLGFYSTRTQEEEVVVQDEIESMEEELDQDNELERQQLAELAAIMDKLKGKDAQANEKNAEIGLEGAEGLRGKKTAENLDMAAAKSWQQRFGGNRTAEKTAEETKAPKKEETVSKEEYDKLKSQLEALQNAQKQRNTPEAMKPEALKNQDKQVDLDALATKLANKMQPQQKQNTEKAPVQIEAEQLKEHEKSKQINYVATADKTISDNGSLFSEIFHDTTQLIQNLKSTILPDLHSQQTEMVIEEKSKDWQQEIQNQKREMESGRDIPSRGRER